MTTLAAGSSVTLAMDAWASLTLVVTGKATLAFTSGADNLRSSFNVTDAQSKTYGPYGVPMSVVVTAVDQSLTYSVGGQTGGFAYGPNGDVIGLTGGASSIVSNANELYSNYEGMTHTGTTAETILYSVLIPGGTIVAPASLEHYLRFQITTTSDAGSRAVRTYLNTANSLSGATAMGDMFHSTISVTYSYLRPGDPIIFPTSTSQLGFPRGNGPNSLNSLAADRTGTLDTADDMYFIVSATLINAADSLSVRSVRLLLNGER